MSKYRISKSLNTGACLDSIKVFADYCSQSRQEPEEKTGLFSKKVALKDTRMQDVSRVILLQLTDANVGLRDFKEKVIAAIKIGEQPDSKLRNS
jgi:hypothetical protein